MRFCECLRRGGELNGTRLLSPKTLALMRAMVAGGEVDHLGSERVWQELAKGLMEERPSRMFEVLRHGGALRVIELFFPRKCRHEFSHVEA